MSFNSESLKKDSCCCGATKAHPCLCMIQGNMKCAAKSPMCPCYKEIAMGIKVEMEHTKSKEKAEKIAKEHLAEHPDYYSRLKSAGLSAENSEPYYEVMVDSSSLDKLADEFGDGLVMEIYDNLTGHVLSLDYGAGGDEPLMTPTEAKEDYMGQISINTYDYEPDADEETGEWFGTPNTNIWRGTINFPEGKQREGGEFFARVFGFNESEFPIESHESQEKVERIILDWVNRTVEVYVRELGEDGNFHTLYDAESEDYLEGVEKGIPMGYCEGCSHAYPLDAMNEYGMCEECEGVLIVDIDWETDGEDPEEMGLPSSVTVPSDLEEDEIADYLSDEYGWLVNGFVMGAETFEAAVVSRSVPKTPVKKAMLNKAMMDKAEIEEAILDLETRVRLGLISEDQIMRKLHHRFGSEEEEFVSCPHCEGSGSIADPSTYLPATRDDPGDVDSMECPYCEGSGEVPEDEADEIPAYDWDDYRPNPDDRWDNYDRYEDRYDAEMITRTSYACSDCGREHQQKRSALECCFEGCFHNWELNRTKDWENGVFTMYVSCRKCGADSYIEGHADENSDSNPTPTFNAESFESDSWLTEGKCAICNSPSKFTVSTAVGERSFCCEACYADYMGLPVKEEGYYGLMAESFEAYNPPLKEITASCDWCGKEFPAKAGRGTGQADSRIYFGNGKEIGLVSKNSLTGEPILSCKECWERMSIYEWNIPKSLFDSENEEGSKAFMVAGIAVLSALSIGIYKRWKS